MPLTRTVPFAIFTSIMGDDCTAGGVTSGRRHAVLVTPGGEPKDEPPVTPVLVMEILLDVDPAALGAGTVTVAKPAFVERLTGERRPSICRVIVRPAGEKVAGMFGGHFVYSSDGRYPFESPVKVFDRYEGRS